MCPTRPGRLPLGRVLVAGPSMVPALRPGDRCLVLWGAPVRPGQLVVAEHPRQPGVLIVKRAVRQEPGGWWLASENPYAGGDSATFGLAPDRLLIGRVLLRYWPPRRRRRAAG